MWEAFVDFIWNDPFIQNSETLVTISKKHGKP